MKPIVAFAWKAVVCAIAFSAGSVAGAQVANALGAALPTIPAGVDARLIALFGLIASVMLGPALGPLSTGLGVGFAARWTILAAFTYVCMGLNTAIEAALFTTMGGTSGMLVFNILPALLFGGALAALFPPTEPAGWGASWRRFWARLPVGRWALRLGAALLAFPAIYFTFGSIVGPFVVDAYRAGQFDLVLPPLNLILPVQLVRSGFFLAASLPVLIAWRGSRLRLVLALGAAHFALVGLFGLVQAFWLPTPMRLIHGAEILADSLAYGAALVFLLRPPDVAQGSSPVASVAA
jgi:hypothetical protein